MRSYRRKFVIVVTLIYSLYIIFTSMLTPDGRERLVNASTTLGLGLRMSITRLCVRISNCSRASLCTKVERLTVYFLISVGSGIGPTTVASKRIAVSMICLVLASRILCSYARTRMRSLLIAPAALSVDVVSVAIMFLLGILARLRHYSCALTE